MHPEIWLVHVALMCHVLACCTVVMLLHVAPGGVEQRALVERAAAQEHSTCLLHCLPCHGMYYQYKLPEIPGWHDALMCANC